MLRLLTLLTLLLTVVGCLSDDPTLKTSSDLTDLLSTRQLLDFELIQERHSLKRTIREEFASDPDIFEFFLNHPVFTARCLKHLRIRNYVVEEVPGNSPEQTHIRIGESPDSLVALDEWARLDNERLYRASTRTNTGGIFDVTLDVTAMLIFSYEKIPALKGVPHSESVKTKIDIWVKLESPALSSAAKTAAPMIGRKVDSKISVGANSAKEMAQVVRQEPKYFADKIRNFDKLDKDEVKTIIAIMKRKKILK